MSGTASNSLKGGWGLCTEPLDHKERTGEQDSQEYMWTNGRGCLRKASHLFISCILKFSCFL